MENLKKFYPKTTFSFTYFLDLIQVLKSYNLEAYQKQGHSL